MAKRAKAPARPPRDLFKEYERERHPRLFIRRMLEAEANRGPWVEGLDEAKAWEKLKHWADLAEQGHLGQKETSLDAEFLEKVFGDALGYRSVSESPEKYYRERNFFVSGAGTADGALGKFSSNEEKKPLAIIELKGADTDLDHDKFSGRTPVQQLWDYLDQLPECPWGILSNYVTIRLYHHDGTPRRAYEEFTVQDFRNQSRFRQFYYVFERQRLLGNRLSPSRALELLKRSRIRQQEVGPELYDDYSRQRMALIEHLVTKLAVPQDEAIRIAQKILDRIVFVAFCEDRSLLPERVIERAYSQLPPFYKVTNPRWQNFKALFGFLDEGNTGQGIPGYNGGLFSNDPPVDELELGDEWTHFFHRVGRYDFRDEVNVDVLGHLFEQSVTELEKLRVVGLLGRQPGSEGEPAMPKSARRKRFGIYYTPPDFTRLIVEYTLGALIRERVESAGGETEHGARIAELRKIKVCDPACGSGAFLIAAYQLLQDTYEEILRQMRADGDLEAQTLLSDVPDWILQDNLYGVDLSPESVEITQLALWIRSARKGRTLADLSRNIVCGNSLVSDPAVHLRAMDWGAAFPAVFRGSAGGFDVLIGNPPWERMKLQEREFFSLAAPDIASAVSAADRRKLISRIETERPELWARYQAAQAAAARNLEYVRNSAEFPLTGRGDVNTYMLFAELARRIVAPRGRTGLLLPSGIATDDTTKEFFGDLIEKQALIALYDFENKEGVFADVHRSFKFCALLMGGAETACEQSDFVFFARNVADLADKERHIELTTKDLKLLNPNTRTCPIFRSRRDAQITKAIYRRVPILVDKSRRAGGSPWGVKLVRMFDQTNDAELFKTAGELQKAGCKPEGNRWINRKQVYLPLYEAKMIQAFDHRAASVRVEAGNWMRQGQPEETSLVEHQNAEFVVLPRFWVSQGDVLDTVGGDVAGGFIGFKDITSPTNQRTMIAAAIPWSGVTNHFPLLTTTSTPRLRMCLLANLNSLVFDYVTRQKIGGVTLNFFIVEQLPTLAPEAYTEKCPWSSRQKLERWISERVLKLTCTAEDMIPLAEAAEFAERVHRWNEGERAKLRAELDAAYFILYGLEREDVDYILSTFQGVRDEDEAHGGAGPTRRAIIEDYEQFKSAASGLGA